MPLPARQFAKNADAADMCVVQILPELLLEALRTLQKGVRRGMVDREQNHRDRISNQLVNLRVERKAVVLRQVNRELLALTPEFEDFREGGQQQAGRGQVLTPGALFQPSPLFCFQDEMPPC